MDRLRQHLDTDPAQNWLRQMHPPAATRRDAERKRVNLTAVAADTKTAAQHRTAPIGLMARETEAINGRRNAIARHAIRMPQRRRYRRLNLSRITAIPVPL